MRGISLFLKSLNRNKRNYKRALKRELLNLLPKPIKHRLMRQLLDIKADLPFKMEFKIAETQSELQQAFEILHDNYVQCSFMEPHPSGMRLNKYSLLPSTTTLIMIVEGSVVGTVSIITRTSIGLPLESRFNIEEYIQPDEIVAEVSALAIHKDFSRGKAQLFLPICNYFYHFIREYMSIHKVFIAVNPSMADFYEGFLFFDKLTEKTEEKYEFANGAPAVGLCGDFNKIYIKMKQVYNHKSSKKNLFGYFIHNEIKEFSFPKRDFYKSTDPILTPEMINYFFVQKSDVLSSLNKNELMYLTQWFPKDLIQKIDLLHNASLNNLKYREQRYFSSIECKILGKKFKVFNLSQTGIKIGGSVNLSLKDEIPIQISIAPGKILFLSGIVTWVDSNRMHYGVKLVKFISKSWKEYILYLEGDFKKLINGNNNENYFHTFGHKNKQTKAS